MMLLHQNIRGHICLSEWPFHLSFQFLATLKLMITSSLKTNTEVETCRQTITNSSIFDFMDNHLYCPYAGIITSANVSLDWALPQQENVTCNSDSLIITSAELGKICGKHLKKKWEISVNINLLNILCKKYCQYYQISHLLSQNVERKCLYIGQCYIFGIFCPTISLSILQSLILLPYFIWRKYRILRDLDVNL